MHELLTGRRPVDFEFPHFSEFGVTVSQGMEDILVDALAWNPEERIPSAEEFQRRLVDLIGYNPATYCGGDGFRFTEAVNRYKAECLDPLLNDLIRRYGNECHTSFIPRNLDYLVVTLACPMPFELVIKKNDSDGVIEFYYKEGILSPSLIGKVDPASDGREAASGIIGRFIDAYENFKSGSWGIM